MPGCVMAFAWYRDVINDDHDAATKHILIEILRVRASCIPTKAGYESVSKSVSKVISNGTFS